MTKAILAEEALAVAAFVGGLVWMRRWERSRRREVIAAGFLVVMGLLLLPTLSRLARETVAFAGNGQDELGAAGRPGENDDFDRRLRALQAPGENIEDFIRAARARLPVRDTWALVGERGRRCAQSELYQWLAFRLFPRRPDCSALFTVRDKGGRPVAGATFPSVLLFWHSDPTQGGRPGFTLVHGAAYAHYTIEVRGPRFALARRG
jgi:hypothetical protein